MLSSIMFGLTPLVCDPESHLKTTLEWTAAILFPDQLFWKEICIRLLFYCSEFPDGRCGISANLS